MEAPCAERHTVDCGDTWHNNNKHSGDGALLAEFFFTLRRLFLLFWAWTKVKQWQWRSVLQGCFPISFIAILIKDLADLNSPLSICGATRNIWRSYVTRVGHCLTIFWRRLALPVLSFPVTILILVFFETTMFAIVAIFYHCSWYRGCNLFEILRLLLGPLKMKKQNHK